MKTSFRTIGLSLAPLFGGGASFSRIEQAPDTGLPGARLPAPGLQLLAKSAGLPVAESFQASTVQGGAANGAGTKEAVGKIGRLLNTVAFLSSGSSDCLIGGSVVAATDGVGAGSLLGGGAACTKHSECQGKCKGHRGEDMKCRDKLADCKTYGHHSVKRWGCPDGWACAPDKELKWGSCTAAPTTSPTRNPTSVPTASPSLSPFISGPGWCNPSNPGTSSHGYNLYHYMRFPSSKNAGAHVAHTCRAICSNYDDISGNRLVGYETDTRLSHNKACYCRFDVGYILPTPDQTGTISPGKGQCPSQADHCREEGNTSGTGEVVNSVGTPANIYCYKYTSEGA